MQCGRPHRHLPACKMRVGTDVSLDAYVCRTLKDGPLDGWLLANEVGTGKTFTYFATVLMHLRELKRRKQRDEEIEARPTLVIMPAGLVLHTFQEAFFNFPQLRFHAYYSSARVTSDVPELSGKVLTQAVFD